MNEYKTAKPRIQKVGVSEVKLLVQVCPVARKHC